MLRSWYKENVVYQIYPQSFKDTNGDGIGDLKGIISKANYLKELGVGIIWLSPIYVSPLYDNGYDIADYYNINNIYGTMADFEEMIQVYHNLDIKVVMDLVVNHTSSEHMWFKEALKDKNSKYHDYYFFKKGKKNGPPTKWGGFFGGSTWEYVEELDEYYLHLFAKEQPDLNWDNPEVREEVKKILRFWLDKGVDGFRCDVINIISKAEGLPEGKWKPFLRGSEHYIDGPRVHEYLTELRVDVLKDYDCFLVGESVFINPQSALSYIREDILDLNMLFQFDHMNSDCFLIKWLPKKFKPINLKKAMTKWQYEINDFAWGSLYFENHDQPRSVSRFGNMKYYKESAKMLAVYLIFQKGTPFIFQGQEIGMTNISLPTIDDYEDVETKNIYKLGKTKLHWSNKSLMKKIHLMSRDNARTMMQWDDSQNAGFSNTKPWFVVNDNYKEINVKNNMEDSDSIYNLYKKIFQLRKEHLVIVYGDYIEYYQKDKDYICYERNLKGNKIVVTINFSDKTKEEKSPYDLSTFTVLLDTYENNNSKEGVLQPYQAKVYHKKFSR